MNIFHLVKWKNLFEINSFNREIVYPIHPRTRKRLQQYSITIDEEKVKVVDPVDYLTFLKLESRAQLILTDSGGVQEEACILKVPCVTLRDNTERPETIQVGANTLAGTKPDEILKKVNIMLNKKNSWKNPFGDGNAAKKIVEILKKKVKEE